MKKRIFAIAVIVICISLCIGGTWAYFSADVIARNVITSGNINIRLIEKDGFGKDFKNVVGVMPGTTVPKVVTVRNGGESTCWIRIRLEKEIELAADVIGEADPELMKLDLDTTHWTEQDGYYYYNNPLEAGVTTEPLFTSVEFDKTMGNMYQESQAALTVYVQAVQTAHNGTRFEEALGWPAD